MGVSADADLVYRALVQLGPRSERALGRELGLPGSRVAAALDELAPLGGAEPGPTRSGSARIRSSAAPPELLTRLRRPPATPSDHDRLLRHLHALDGLDLPTVDRDAVRHWPSRAVTRRRIAHLVAAEQHEHLAVNTEEVFSSESWAAALPLDRSLLDRGIRVRVLSRPLSDHDRGVPAPRPAPRPRAGSGSRRSCPLFPADPLNFDAGFVEVAHPPAVRAPCGLFQRLWARGHDPFRQGASDQPHATGENPGGRRGKAQPQRAHGRLHDAGADGPPRRGEPLPARAAARRRRRGAPAGRVRPAGAGRGDR